MGPEPGQVVSWHGLFPPREGSPARRRAGALGREPAQPSAIGHRDSRFMLIGIGVTPTPEGAELVRTPHARLAEAMRPFTTCAIYVNFMELDGATPERVRAAYSPEDWERLVALKDRYDPENVFRFNRNIPPSSATQ